MPRRRYRRSKRIMRRRRKQKGAGILSGFLSQIGLGVRKQKGGFLPPRLVASWFK